MSVTVVHAWHDSGCPYRRRAFDWVRRYWRWPLPYVEVITETSQPFSRARALNKAVRSASNPLILQVDPDSFVPFPQALRALEMAADADGLVIAFDHYRYLTEQSTRNVIDGGARPPLETEFEGPGGVGNVTAYRRSTWEQVGGYDERFGMWGGDDGAFAYAAEQLVAPLRRVPGPMIHLWHPRLPESEPGHPQYQQQFALVAEYRDATSREEMAALIAARS